MKLKKKVMAVVLAAAMTASLMVPAFGSTYETQQSQQQSILDTIEIDIVTVDEFADSINDSQPQPRTGVSVMTLDAVRENSSSTLVDIVLTVNTVGIGEMVSGFRYQELSCSNTSVLNPVTYVDLSVHPGFYRTHTFGASTFVIYTITTTTIPLDVEKVKFSCKKPQLQYTSNLSWNSVAYFSTAEDILIP